MTAAVADAPAPRLGQRARAHVVHGLTQTLSGAKAMFVVGWEKVPVPEIESLRRSLNTVSAALTVVKNSLGQRALRDSGLATLGAHLRGTSAVTAAADPVAVSKVLMTFANGHEGFVVRGAMVEGQALTVEAIKALAALPSREVLLAKVVGMQAPARGLVGVLSGVLRQAVFVIEAIRKSKEKSS
ncbi:MAG: 50S ribosomal protein L10 [Candidatus Omnitrophica bacterium]|nr:50S ribosomal protein L10 [Candidatus Omnitrophota bacterium]